MANDLTGDYDVVAQFSVPAVNRLLAAMHRNERFFHSITLRVDDVPRHGLFPRPSVVSSVDAFSDTSVNHSRVGGASSTYAPPAAGTLLASLLDTVVNPNGGIINPGTDTPSFLQGVAQLQCAPPVLFVTDQTGTKVTVAVDVMSRYIPDAKTAAIPEFIRGNIRLTADVTQVASIFPNADAVIDINVHADSVGIEFLPEFPLNLTGSDLSTIVLAIRNALKTSLLPTNVTVPQDVITIQFKTLAGTPQPAVCALLNLDLGFGHGGTNTGSVTKTYFTSPDEALAIGISRDLILAKFKDALTGAFQPGAVTFRIAGVDVTYTLSLDPDNPPSLDLQPPDRLVVTVKGHGHPLGHAPAFDFTFQQDLHVIVPPGSIDIALGNNSLDLEGNNPFTTALLKIAEGDALSSIQKTLLQQFPQNPVHAAVQDNLGPNALLGKFLNSLLAPSTNTQSFPAQAIVVYTSVDIQSSGIVLHGSMAVSNWPPPHVEFEQIPIARRPGVGGNTIFDQPDYSALNTWIPGGLITEYDWAFQGQTQPFVDKTKFVLLNAGQESTTASAAVNPGATRASIVATPTPYAPLCLTVRGTRLSPFGRVTADPVNATACGFISATLLNSAEFSDIASRPLVALTQPGLGGLVHLAGHTAAHASRANSNLIVHFADPKNAAHLEFLTQAFEESKRNDASSVIVAVLASEQLAKAPYRNGIVYTDDQGGLWHRAFAAGSERRPLTLIVEPSGKVVFRHEGPIDHNTLAAALAKLLVRAGVPDINVLRASPRLGQPPPNFLLEFAAGRGMTLRKLAGRPAVLVFWKSTLKPSIQAVQDLEDPAVTAPASGRVLLAINDRDPIDLAKRVAKENGFSALLVTDPLGEISTAYGVNVWPTIVSLDSLGLVTQVQYGRSPGRATGSHS